MINTFQVILSSTTPLSSLLPGCQLCSLLFYISSLVDASQITDNNDPINKKKQSAILKVIQWPVTTSNILCRKFSIFGNHTQPLLLMFLDHTYSFNIKTKFSLSTHYMHHKTLLSTTSEIIHFSFSHFYIFSINKKITNPNIMRFIQSHYIDRQPVENAIYCPSEVWCCTGITRPHK